jgi:hypothetical protein
MVLIWEFHCLGVEGNGKYLQEPFKVCIGDFPLMYPPAKVAHWDMSGFSRRKGHGKLTQYCTDAVYHEEKLPAGKHKSLAFQFTNIPTQPHRKLHGVSSLRVSG